MIVLMKVRIKYLQQDLVIPCDDDVVTANRAAEETLLELLSEMDTFDFLLEDRKKLIQSGGCLVQKVMPETDSMKTILETTTMLVVAAANGEEKLKNICVCGDKTTQNLKARATMKYDDLINSLSELVSIVAMVTSILFIKAVSDVFFFHGGPGPPLLINYSLHLLP